MLASCKSYWYITRHFLCFDPVTVANASGNRVKPRGTRTQVFPKVSVQRLPAVFLSNSISQSICCFTVPADGSIHSGQKYLIRTCLVNEKLRVWFASVKKTDTSPAGSLLYKWCLLRIASQLILILRGSLMTWISKEPPIRPLWWQFLHEQESVYVV